MSDLQCPATVIVVRHGQSEGNVSRRMSASVPGPPLSDQGREQARALGESLRERRVARVYASPLLRAQQTAQELARVLGVDVETLDGVQEFGLGTLEGSDSAQSWTLLDTVFLQWLDGDLTLGVGGDETGEQVVERFGQALDAVADLHRGETVVVVSHAGAMALALPPIAGVGSAMVRGRPLANTAAVELEQDGDGWRLLHWPNPPRWRGIELVDRIGRADAARAAVTGREVAAVAGAACSHLPIAASWATSASFTAMSGPPSAEQVREATAWCEQRSPGSWRVVIRGEHVGDVIGEAQGRLHVEQTLGVMAAWELPQVPVVDGLVIAEARDEQEFLSVYGAELAPLVHGRLGQPGLAFLVGRLGGDPVGCARVWDVDEMAYVSAVQVRPDLRGRGIGRALSATATAFGLRRHPMAWLHCEDDLSGLYASIGYRPVTTHVGLTPAPDDPTH